MLEQAAEAAVGAVGRIVLAGGLGLGGGGTAGRGDGVALSGRVLVGVGQRGLGFAEVPGEVAGEHADQHVGPDAFSQPAEDDGPQHMFRFLKQQLGWTLRGGIRDGRVDEAA